MAAVALMAIGALTKQVEGAAFTPGNVVVVKVDGSGAALAAQASKVILEEYTTSGTFVQSVALPTAVSGSSRRLTIQGSAISEGFLTLSADGQSFVMTGYDADLGTLAASLTTSSVVNRVIGRVNVSGQVDTTTALTDAYSGSGSAIRSATTLDGSTFWTGGNASAATGGVRFAPYASTTSSSIATTTSNTRVLDSGFGQLFVTSGSSGFTGVCTVGTGIPTTGPQTITILPGFPTSGTHSPYDFFVPDTATIYLADDGTTANGGGIQKWQFNGTTWSRTYVLGGAGMRGVTGFKDNTGTNHLFATTGASSGNAIVAVVDTGATSTTTTLVTAPNASPNFTAFRGIRYLPCPTFTVNAGSGGTVCSNSTIQLAASTTAPPTATLQWSGGSGTFSQPHSLLTNYTPGANDNGLVTLTLTASAAAPCSNSASGDVQITVVPAPVAPSGASANPPSFCDNNTAGQTLTLSVSSPGSGGTLTWYRDGCGPEQSGVSVGTGSPLVISAPSVTTLYLARRVGGSCGNSTCASVLVTVGSPGTELEFAL